MSRHCAARLVLGPPFSLTNQEHAISEARLFDLPALEQQAKTTAYQALGVSAQMLLVARLLELDHKVAIPVTDDDGVDLIVNYQLLVQVKSSSARDAQGRLRVPLQTRRATERNKTSRHAHYIREHVDILAVYGRDSRSWWFIHRDQLQHHPTQRLTEHSGDPAHEAWHVFDRHA